MANRSARRNALPPRRNTSMLGRLFYGASYVDSPSNRPLLCRRRDGGQPADLAQRIRHRRHLRLRRSGGNPQPAQYPPIFRRRLGHGDQQRPRTGAQYPLLPADSDDGGRAGVRGFRPAPRGLSPGRLPPSYDDHGVGGATALATNRGLGPGHAARWPAVRGSSRAKRGLLRRLLSDDTARRFVRHRRAVGVRAHSRTRAALGDADCSWRKPSRGSAVQGGGVCHSALRGVLGRLAPAGRLAAQVRDGRHPDGLRGGRGAVTSPCLSGSLQGYLLRRRDRVGRTAHPWCAWPGST